jgi:hypothetical protein
MANIYEVRNEELHVLLKESATDATVLIPDLQRPYVWTPNQVTLLVDSLIRGWPFGTLLMWKVKEGGLQEIPHRGFWQVVDRTKDGNGNEVLSKNPPGSYHMVLDGQQRLQSLLLALAGDAWGFKLEDRDWAEELQGRRPRGRRDGRWSKASLSFDLDCFLEEYTKSRNNLQTVDFGKVLQWVITDPVSGQSTGGKPNNYQGPLLRSYEPQHKGRFVRLFRLWHAAEPNPNLKEAHFRDKLKPLFRDEEVPDEKAEKLLPPMAELMTTLRDLKLSKVTYLELVPFDPDIWTEVSYNDAIVNIFTRLNTAGRTLTREEITFAWLKVGWNRAETNGKTAGDCFKELLEELKKRDLEIEMDNLVNAVSFIWSVCYNEGKILANSDLLRGDAIRPMVSELAKHWSDIQRALLKGIDEVKNRGLEYGPAGQYSSLNALAVVWAWLYLAFEWETSHGLTVPQKDGFEKNITATLASVLDRWLICSQWAGRWAGSSAPIVGYAKDLHQEFLGCRNLDTPESVQKLLSDRFQAFVKELETDATNYFDTLAASTRERVSVYRTALWIWHRLDEKRWEKSSISLRVGKSKPKLEVDHTVAYALWEKKLDSGLPTGFKDKEKALQLVNRLGNCALLEKTFNISKSDKTLRQFMEQIHEFKDGKVELTSWAQALMLEDSMLDPSAATTDSISQAIQTRDAAMRAELVDFVEGTKSRVDL